MSKHTPGPWKLSPLSQDPQAVALYCRFVHRSDGLATFRIGFGYEDPETDKANARLIAAAPELLEACNYLIGICTGEKEPDSEKINEAISIAAKAEGRS